MLDVKGITNINNNESSEGKRTFSSSNECGIRFPSLDFLDTSDESLSEEIILDYLAEIVSRIYLRSICKNKSKEEQ